MYINMLIIALIVNNDYKFKSQLTTS